VTVRFLEKNILVQKWLPNIIECNAMILLKNILIHFIVVPNEGTAIKVVLKEGTTLEATKTSG